MNESASHSPKDERVGTLRDTPTTRQFIDARDLLKRYLVHTREILNGKDYLFLGPKTELHNALKLIVDVEHGNSRFLHVDFAQVDEYFLLRVVGSEANQQLISEYFG